MCVSFPFCLQKALQHQSLMGNCGFSPEPAAKKVEKEGEKCCCGQSGLVVKMSSLDKSRCVSLLAKNSKISEEKRREPSARRRGTKRLKKIQTRDPLQSLLLTFLVVKKKDTQK